MLSGIRNILFFLCLFTGVTKNESKRKFKISFPEVEENDVRFFLYTRNNLETPDELKFNDIDSIINSHLDIYKKMKLIIHGWKNSGNSLMNLSLRTAYLDRIDVNVISVDWERLSRKFYPISRLLVSKVGQRVANMIDYFVTLGFPLDDIHVIGHSLGAHVAGAAGQRITSGNLSRITGLDPAGPLFYKRNPTHLKPTDAQFVDVIHTSGHYLGFYESLGHVDFYPNGGTPAQPGCGFDFIGKCSHQRAFWYFAESILNVTKFIATSCDSWVYYKKEVCTEEVEMGEYVNKDARGIFYLKTNGKFPFAIGNSSYSAHSTGNNKSNETEMAAALNKMIVSKDFYFNTEISTERNQIFNDNLNVVKEIPSDLEKNKRNNEWKRNKSIYRTTAKIITSDNLDVFDSWNKVINTFNNTILNQDDKGDTNYDNKGLIYLENQEGGKLHDYDASEQYQKETQVLSPSIKIEEKYNSWLNEHNYDDDQKQIKKSATWIKIKEKISGWMRYNHNEHKKDDDVLKTKLPSPSWKTIKENIYGWIYRPNTSTFNSIN